MSTTDPLDKMYLFSLLAIEFDRLIGFGYKVNIDLHSEFVLKRVL